MNREIKFRAWMPKYKEMVILENTGLQSFDCENGYSVLFTADGYDEIWAHENYGKVKGAVIMQYTGLKDKNGKEIYEGDIVKFNDLVCEVYWDYAGFRIKPFPNSSISINTNRDFEVIGNIYENPELLSRI